MPKPGGNKSNETTAQMYPAAIIPFAAVELDAGVVGGGGGRGGTVLVGATPLIELRGRHSDIPSCQAKSDGCKVPAANC